MCGFTGYYLGNNNRSATSNLYKATSLIRHRGPDDEGYLLYNTPTNTNLHLCGPDSPRTIKDKYSNINSRQEFSHNFAMGFRRLSLVELSDKGHQPYSDDNNKVFLTFNGEIYNHQELRSRLSSKYNFKSNSDTEVLLAGYKTSGLNFLNECNGPIAAAIVDLELGKQFLIRDRIGKNPLYYSISAAGIFWGSEIKTIHQLAPEIKYSISDQNVYDYLSYGWRDIERTTFWNNIYSVPAASWIEFDLNSPTDQTQPIINKYWNIPTARRSTAEISFSEAKNKLTEILTDSINIRQKADAPVGFSLSGGIDSSSLLALGVSNSTNKATAYTVKYPGDQNDEEPFARLVYQHYADKVDYRVFTPGENDFWNEANDYIWLLEEPFHFPVAYVFNAYFRQARKDGFKAMIIGAGGDELFAGYDCYKWPYYQNLSKNKKYLELIAALHNNASYSRGAKLKYFRMLLADHNYHKNKGMLFSNFNQSGLQSVSPYLNNNFIAKTISKTGPRNLLSDLLVDNAGAWLMQYWQNNSNKSHMGVPMEPRSPLLDYRVVEYAFQLPTEYLIKNGRSKYILRKALSGKVPNKILWDKKKRGFPFNTQEWYRNSKPIITSILKEYSDNPYVDNQKLIQDYDKLAQDNSVNFWRMINLNLWLKRVVDGSLL